MSAISVACTQQSPDATLLIALLLQRTISAHKLASYASLLQLILNLSSFDLCKQQQNEETSEARPVVRQTVHRIPLGRPAGAG